MIVDGGVFIPKHIKELNKNVSNAFKKAKDSFSEEVVSIEEKLSLIGYKVSSVELSLTIPPRFAFEIDAVHSCLNKEIKEIMLKNASPLLKGIILALDNIFDVEKKVSFKNKVLSTVVIEGSLIPTVKLIYKEIS